MRTCLKWRGAIIALFAAVLVNAGLVKTTRAGIIQTQSVVRANPFTATAPNAEIRERLRVELAALGVKGTFMDARLAALSDSEAARLSERLHDAPAGEGGAILVVGILVGIWLLLGWATNWNSNK